MKVRDDLKIGLRKHQLQYGISLQTIIKELYLKLIEYEMQNNQKSYIIQRLGEIEYRLSIGCD